MASLPWRMTARDWTGSEDNLHKAVASYLEKVLPPDTWTTVEQRNDGGKGKAGMIRAQARKLRGVKSGWPDLLIHYRGFTDNNCLSQRTLYIELKKKGGSQSPRQKEVTQSIEALGIPVCVAKSVDEVEAILTYYNVPKGGSLW